MTALREWAMRAWSMFRRGRRDDDLEEELRAHLEMAAESAERRGHDADEATRIARLDAGGTAQAMESLRDQRGLPWVDDLARDIAYAVRGARRAPVFTAVALLTLALGVGANTAIFSILNSIILRPLPYPAPEQLFRLKTVYSAIGDFTVSNPEYDEFRTMTRTFAHVGAFAIGGTTGNGNGAWTGAVNVTCRSGPVRVRSALVDEHLFSVLGVQPLHGRLFGPGETDAAPPVGLGGPLIAILSYELWQSGFGGEPLVGRTIEVDGRLHEVLGIMPPAFDLMDHRTEIWLPLGVHPAIRRIRSNHILSVVGRLRNGITPQQAERELAAFLMDWAAHAGRPGSKEHVPARELTDTGHTLRLEPLQDSLVGNARRAVWVLQGAVGLVLLIACANLASLIMARAESRRGELAVRAALGASRGRLLRQAVTEGVVLSLTGGVLGVLLARGGVRALVAAYPNSLPRTTEVTMDVSVLAFALGVSIVTGILFGLIPIAHPAVGDFVAALKDAGSRAAGSAGRHRVRRALVMVEIALAVILVAGAALLLRTVYNLSNVDAGFERARLATFSITLPRATGYQGGHARAYQRVLEALRAQPGVDSATAMSDLPFGRVIQGWGTEASNYTGPDGRRAVLVEYYQFVMSDYFRTMGIPIVAGRGFDAQDTVSGRRTVVINESLANRLWKGGNPIGQELVPQLSMTIGTNENPRHTVIGVAKDVKAAGVDRPAGAELYLFVDQPGPPIDGTREPWVLTAALTMQFAVRTSLPPAALATTVERVVRSVDPSVPVARLREMEDVFTESIRRPRLLAQLLAGFGAVALLLAAIGTYGVLSYMVSERRREIGVRMALGASRSRVLALVARYGLAMAGVGVVAGVASAFALSRSFESLLFGVNAMDSTTMIGVATSIGLVAVAACAVPAWRASMLPPMSAMRDEPESIWRTASAQLSRLVKEINTPNVRTADTGTLARDVAASVHGADSFPDAVRLALDTLRVRFDATVIVLLERSGSDYRSPAFSIPATGALVNRLRHYPHPLALEAGDFAAWRQWASEAQTRYVDEIETLAGSRACVAVPLRTAQELVGILLLGPPAGRTAFTATERAALGAVSGVFALMIENARLNERSLEQEKLRRDLALAAEVQRRLLPEQPPLCEGVEFAAFTLPARSVGGDYYDFLERPGGRVGLALADVSGKGVPAALLMSALQASLRVLAAERELPGPDLARQLNRFIYRSTAAHSYATFFYAELDVTSHTLRYVNAGHNPPYLVHRDNGKVDLTELTVGGTVIGMFPEVDYQEAQVDARCGDLLVLVTDGVTEARSASGEEYGEERLREFIRGAADLPAAAIASALAAQLRDWIAGCEQHDDVTFIVAALT
jgi:putative ABC transport system permease protein